MSVPKWSVFNWCSILSTYPVYFYWSMSSNIKSEAYLGCWHLSSDNDTCERSNTSEFETKGNTAISSTWLTSFKCCIRTWACMHNYSFKSEPTDCFCYATKQTYYSGQSDPETPHQFRWDSLQQLWTAKSRWLLLQSAPS